MKYLLKLWLHINCRQHQIRLDRSKTVRQIEVIMIPNKYYKNLCGNDQSDEQKIS